MIPEKPTIRVVNKRGKVLDRYHQNLKNYVKIFSEFPKPGDLVAYITHHKITNHNKGQVTPFLDNEYLILFYRGTGDVQQNKKGEEHQIILPASTIHNPTTNEDITGKLFVDLKKHNYSFDSQEKVVAGYKTTMSQSKGKYSSRASYDRFSKNRKIITQILFNQEAVENALEKTDLPFSLDDLK